MRIFGTDSSSNGDASRGCFVAFDIDVAGSRGAVLQLPNGKDRLPDHTQPAYPLLVVGVSFNQNEIAQFLKCFGGRIYTYAFGGDLGDLKVDFVGFLAGGVSKELGADGGPDTQFQSSNIVQDFCQKYKSSRLSVSQKTATLSMAGGYLQGLIVGMQSATISPENNMQAFSMVLKLVEVQGGDAGAPGSSESAGNGGTPASDSQANSDWQSAVEAGGNA